MGSQPLKPILVPTAPGELIDKIAILQIKVQRLGPGPQLQHVQADLALLTAIRDRAVTPSSALDRLTQALAAVNEELWQAEDDIRACEQAGDFGPKFVAVARSIYQTNDRRAQLKRQIDEFLGSEIIEEKLYGP